jgi:branched-chain amino acid transport system substrate-binding protein
MKPDPATAARRAPSAIVFLLLLLATISVPSSAPSSSRARAHAPGSNPRDRTAEIAVLLDLAGAQASIGRPALNGFLLALQQQAIGDAPRVLAAQYDTRTDPQTTRRAAEDAAAIAVAAAGFTDNDSVLVAGPPFHDAGVPFLSIGATDPTLPETVGENVFLVPFGDNTQAAAGAEHALREFGSAAAILWDSTSAYTRTLPRYFRTRFAELGGQILLDASYQGCDAGELGQQVAALAPAASFVYLAGLPDCIGEVVASLRQAGVGAPILGGDGLDTPNLLEGGPGPTDDVRYTTHAWLSADTGTPQARQFLADYEEAYGTAPQDAFAALGYDAGNLLLDALRRADKVKKRSILDALEATRSFAGVTGTISFTASDHVPRKTVWIVQVEAGQAFLADSFVPDRVPPPIVDGLSVLP